MQIILYKTFFVIGKICNVYNAKSERKDAILDLTQISESVATEDSNDSSILEASSCFYVRFR